MTIPTAPSMDSKTALALRYAERWVTELSNALTSADVSALLSLLQPSAWFRDLLVFTWDIRSTKGHNDIRAYLLNTLPKANISGVKLDLREGLRPRLEELGNSMGIVDVAFTFETPRAHGRGCAKALVPLDNQDEANGADAGPSNLMKAMCVMFMVNDWKGHEEINYETKLPGGHTLAWEELVNQKREEAEKDPQVVIIGSGHTGLQVAARLQQMNIRVLVIEKNARVGDNWRKRYPTLYLHTPRTHHQLLYQPFPSNWPKFTSKDKLANWLEQYVDTNDLTVWTSTEIIGKPTYDKISAKWTIRVEAPHGSEGGQRTQRILNPTHLITAIGLYGDPRMPVDPTVPVAAPTDVALSTSKFKPTPPPVISGYSTFPGISLHSASYPGGAPFAGQRVLVVGACNTAVDICQDLVHNHASSVTMLQRSATTVASDKLVDIQLSKLWPEGEDVEVSDFWVAGACLGMAKEMMIGMKHQREEFDKEMRDGLKSVGFKISEGPQGAGQLLQVFERAQGYFIDVGCASLIISGQVKIKQGTSVEAIEGKRIFFTDGSTIEVDALIFATGWNPSREKLYTLLGDEVMDQTEETWGIDEHGELRGGFKPSGYPGLWVTAADFANMRWYSKQMGLFIKAIDLGYVTYDDFKRVTN